jgi:outer membrane protein OmpA-like peptidoglycan-associated protein
MKRQYILISLLTVILLNSLFPGLLYSQEDKTVSQQKVSMEVLVVDYQNNPREGEKIIFVDTGTQKEYSGVTNEEGTFTIKLPGGKTYLAKIEGVGTEQDYQTFTMPQPKEGQVMGTTRFTIKYDPPKVYTLDNVYFDVGKATLRKESYAELNELVDYMKRREDIRVEIAGHTDNTGSKEDNLKLSQRRAEKVEDYLISKGIDARRIDPKGYGEDQPIASNKTKEGRQKNRRTEVHIIEGSKK